MLVIERSKLFEATILKKGVPVSGVTEKPDKFEVSHYQGTIVNANENDYVVTVAPGKYFVVSAADFEKLYLEIKE